MVRNEPGLGSFLFDTAYIGGFLAASWLLWRAMKRMQPTSRLVVGLALLPFALVGWITDQIVTVAQRPSGAGPPTEQELQPAEGNSLGRRRTRDQTQAKMERFSPEDDPRRLN